METTLFPVATLPACVTSCGHLYDANGACVPPAQPAATLASYASCFCSNSLLTPFSTGTAGVCDNACTAEAGGLSSIQAWFTSYCSANAKGELAGEGATVTMTASVTGSSGAGGSGGSSDGGGASGDWLSTHWQWVVFIVVVAVGIAGIWVGACVWRRRYLRKKDREYALGRSLGGAGAAAPSQGASQPGVRMPQAGMFAPASISTANVYETEKPQSKRERQRWVVSERT